MTTHQTECYLTAYRYCRELCLLENPPELFMYELLTDARWGGVAPISSRVIFPERLMLCYALIESARSSYKPELQTHTGELLETEIGES